MVAAKKWTKTDLKDSQILALTPRLTKLDKTKTSVLEKVQGGGGNTTQTRTNTKERVPNMSYVEVINNI